MASRTNALRQWLLRPYPLWRGAWPELQWILAASALAVVLILVTRPFGLSRLPSGVATPLILQLALAAALAGILLRVAIPPLLERWRIDLEWSVGRELAWAAVEVAVLAAALMAVLIWHGWVRLTLLQALLFLGITALCSMIPMLMRTLLVERWLRTRQQAQVERLLPDDLPSSVPAPAAIKIGIATLRLRAQDATVELPMHALRYVRAEENYVQLVWILDGKCQRRLLRATLSEFESQLKDHGVVRCHRSYLVALSAVVEVTGDAQGCRLHLSGIQEAIPVARLRAGDFLDRLRRSRA
jgi:DNA-binding LytR/AlgR family response regulator